MLWWLLRRKRLLVLAVCLFASLGVRGQCTTQAGFQCVSDATMSRLAKALDESAAKDALIAAYKAAGVLNDAERAAFQAALKATNEAFEARGKAIIDRDAVIALQQKVVDAFAVLVEKLTNQLNRPRSGWQKFLAILEKIVYIAAGVSLGRGL